MEKYKGVYRIESARARWWDYAWDAAYFVTICTWNRECIFGSIKDDIMRLSPRGSLANSCWADIPNHTKNLQLGEYVVMPNHVHGILILKGNQTPFVETSTELRSTEERRNLSDEPDLLKTIGQLRLRHPGKNTISTIVGGYKAAVSRESRRLRLHFEWQTRFHDHIIRDEEEFARITEYIRNNPATWKDDNFYPKSDD